jgi:hypothetical protein
MIKNAILACACLLFPFFVFTQNPDPRYIENGYDIHSGGYIDQPYIVTLEDGTWLCVFTTGKLEEGLDGQHIAATRSSDLGKTWSPPVALEPAAGPPASWAMPYLTSYGRVYVFYVFNGDNISELDGKKIRNDMLGWYCYRYSDDGGLTWSEQHRMPMRITAADRANDWQGRVQIFWGIGKPVTAGGGMMLGFTKVGKYMLDNGEGWFFYCENINSERDPALLKWQLLPDGEHGVRNPEYGSVQEEHNLVTLSDGSLYCVYRTQVGYLIESYSRDGGHTWSLPSPARYADGRPVKTSRACPRIWKCQNGKFLLWFHNHSGDHFSTRNPAWLSGGVEADGEIRWSQPEIFLYGGDLSYESGRFSYPDMVEQNGRYWITETNKLQARIHEVPLEMLEKLWGQFDRRSSTVSRQPVMHFTEEDLKKEKLPITGFPENSEGGFILMNAMRPDSYRDGGLTIEMTVQPKDFSHARVLLDTRNEFGSGLYIQTTGYRQLEVNLCNTEYCETWTTDPGLLDIVKPHDVTLIIDNGPDIVMWVVDGKLCDGGTSRQFGWKHYSPFLGRILTNKEEVLRIMPEELKSLRIYDYAMLVSEAVNNQKGR